MLGFASRDTPFYDRRIGAPLLPTNGAEEQVVAVEAPRRRAARRYRHAVPGCIDTGINDGRGASGARGGFDAGIIEPGVEERWLFANALERVAENTNISRGVAIAVR